MRFCLIFLFGWCNNYCKRIWASRYRNVLAPREAGFYTIQEILHQNDKYTDITLDYDVDMKHSVEPLTILEFLQIRPRNVKIIIDESSSSIVDTYRKKDDIIEYYRRKSPSYRQIK